MANLKISQLPAAGTLDADALMPVVQDGTTQQTTVARIRDGLACADLSNVGSSVFAAKAATVGITPGPALSSLAAAPLAATPAAGTGTAAARSDHVHPLPSPAALGAAAAAHTHALADSAGLVEALAQTMKQGLHTLWIPAAAMAARPTAGAAAASVETGSARILLSTLDFDSTSQEHAQFTLALPKSWDRGPVACQALWTATGGSGGVVFGLRAVSIPDGGTADAGFGPAVTVTDTLTAAGAVHVTPVSAPLTVGGTVTGNGLTVFEVFRDAADDADTLAQDAQLLGLRLFLTINAATDA